MQFVSGEPLGAMLGGTSPKARGSHRGPLVRRRTSLLLELFFHSMSHVAVSGRGGWVGVFLYRADVVEEEAEKGRK